MLAFYAIVDLAQQAIWLHTHRPKKMVYGMLLFGEMFYTTKVLLEIALATPPLLLRAFSSVCPLEFR